MEVYRGGYRSLCYHADPACKHLRNYAAVTYDSAASAESDGLYPCRSCTAPRLKCDALTCIANQSGVCLQHYWQGSPQTIPITGCIDYPALERRLPK